MPDREPWKCPQCKAWVPPWAESHRCDPDGGVTARLGSGPPGPPPATVTLTAPAVQWAGGSHGGHPAAVVTVTSVEDLVPIVRREVMRYHARNGGAA